MDNNRSERPRQDPRAMASEMSRLWQAMAAEASHIASSKRALFDAYVAEGFTEAQALELVKSP